MHKFTVVFYDERDEIVAEETVRFNSVEEAEEWAENNREDFSAEHYIVG